MNEKSGTYCQCLYYSVNALARIISRMAEEEFAITGFAPSYAFVLMTVKSNPGIQPTEIASIMQLTPSTVTRLIEKLESRGFIIRITEGKKTKINPTDKVEEIEPKIKEAWNNLYNRYKAILGEGFSANLTRDIYSACIILDSSVISCS
jgi:MarR family transcriptional regulator, organic hydroperoxide resistance regulator